MGHYIGKDGSISVREVELSGDYDAVVVLSSEAAPQVAASAMRHLTNVAETKTKPLNGHGQSCPKCGTAHDVRAHLRPNSHVIVMCGCGYQMRVISEPIFWRLGQRVKVY